MKENKMKSKRKDHSMTKDQAVSWVYDQDENDGDVDESQLEAAFRALYGRPSDEEDQLVGVWSLCCAATENCGTRP